MPAVLRKDGFRFHFYFADEFEPPHIHVEKGGRACRFWLQQVALSRNDGFKQHELNKICRIIEENQELLVGEWRRPLRPLLATTRHWRRLPTTHRRCPLPP